jgi:hypothetical protein
MFNFTKRVKNFYWIDLIDIVVNSVHPFTTLCTHQKALQAWVYSSLHYILFREYLSACIHPIQ